MKTVMPKGIWKAVMWVARAMHRGGNRLLDLLEDHYDSTHEYNSIRFDESGMKIIFSKVEES